MIRVRITKSKVSDNLSVRDQLQHAGLRNKNRGRNVEKRPFDEEKMGGKYSLLDTPYDVGSDYSTKKSYKK